MKLRNPISFTLPKSVRTRWTSFVFGMGNFLSGIGFNAWKHNNAICVIPYIGIQWYPTNQIGNMRFQINSGFLLWSISIFYKW